MRRRLGPAFAWACWSLFVVLIVTGFWLDLSGRVEHGLAEDLPIVIAFFAYATMGSLLVTQRPENVIGWTYVGVGFFSILGGFAENWTEYAFPHGAPLGVLGAWIHSWFWYPTIAFAIVFPLFYFPTGRLPSRRWWPVAAAAVGLLVVLCFAGATQPVLRGDDYAVDNPIGISWSRNLEEAAGIEWGLNALLVAGALAMVVRFRRSRGEERLQLKWFTFAAAMIAVSIPLEPLLAQLGRVVSDVAIATIFAFVPVATGVAILRYRLYDIDRLISRALVYLVVTGTLVGVYAATVFAVGTVAAGSTDDLTVAVATLVAAALFRPLLVRVRDFVDRRFYRRRYDAQRTVDEFGSRLRQETDLEYLTKDLVRVVDATVQPAHVSLWLRGPEAR